MWSTCQLDELVRSITTQLVLADDRVEVIPDAGTECWHGHVLQRGCNIYLLEVGKTGRNCNSFQINAHYVEHVFYCDITIARLVSEFALPPVGQGFCTFVRCLKPSSKNEGPYSVHNTMCMVTRLHPGLCWVICQKK